MAKERAAFLALLLFVVSAGPIKGYILTSYTANGYDSVGADNSLREMRALGVECVEIVFTWYLQTLNTTSIAPDLARTPSDHGIARMVKLAHSLNMSTAFKPHVDLVDDSWRAAIGVGYNESQWADFFGNLTAYLCHYADLAAANGVELFNLGTELEMTHERDADWRSVIAAVRQRAPQTKLWISPNYEYYVLPLPGYWFVPFWDALDFLGVSILRVQALGYSKHCFPNWELGRPRLRILCNSYSRHTHSQIQVDAGLSLYIIHVVTVADICNRSLLICTFNSLPPSCRWMC